MEEPSVILFDGVCNYCNHVVNFVLRQDRKKNLRFAPLQSAAGQRLLTEHGLDQTAFDSFVLIRKGKVYQKSTAALAVMNELPWYWKEVQILRVVPRFLRDTIYDFIARNRYRWFGRRDACMVPTADMRSRFLD
jgi:predicted DCC family thiol-disulfide oxidoreductase YuxK